MEVAGAILQALRGHGKPATLRDVAELTGLAPSRLHHYLVSLVRIGLVHRDAITGYDLGSFALELGLAAADNMELQHLSAPVLHRLSAETHDSSFFSIGSGRGALIVRWEQGSRPLTVHARLGTVMPILTSATGLVWLAYDPEGSASILEGEIRKINPFHRKRVRDGRLNDAAEVRARGVASAQGTMIANVNAFACPVLSRSSKLAGVLTVLGLGGYFDRGKKGHTARCLAACAKELGMKLP